MACRIGMAKEPFERINYWLNEEGHTHSEILAEDLTYDQALAREKHEAELRGCIYQGGGQRFDGHVWCVYHVWGGTIKQMDSGGEQAGTG